MKRILPRFVAALLLSLALASTVWQPAATSAAGTGSGLPTRSAQEVAAMWKKLMMPAADHSAPYTTKPSTTSPYLPGALKAHYIRDGVNAINFFRFIAGLPDDIVSTAALNLQAQYGSVLLAAEDNFSHTPSKPADMKKDFYDKGYASTSTANIYAAFGYDDHTVMRSINAYMEDSDEGNMDRIGHRRWILNPQLKNVGIGQAESSEGWTYSALQVFDTSRTKQVAYQYVAYPAQGAFPIEVFEPFYVWSVSLNPKEFAEPAQKSVKVTIKRLSDNRTWSLDNTKNKVSKTGAYFNVENMNYGSGPAIIFRPNGIDAYRAGDKYTVTINGLKSPAGAAKQIVYTVEFMSAEKTNPTPPATGFTDIEGHWGKKTIEWAAAQGIVSNINGPFRPNDKVNEDQFLKMFAESIGADVPPVASGTPWSTNYYAFATEKGYNLRGVADAQARTKPFTRLAVAELIVSAAGEAATGNDAIQYMIDNGYTSATSITAYKGSGTLSRAEAVQFIKNIVDAGFSV